MSVPRVVRVGRKSSDHSVRSAAFDVLNYCVKGCIIPNITGTDVMKKGDFCVSGLHSIIYLVN